MVPAQSALDTQFLDGRRVRNGADSAADSQGLRYVSVQSRFMFWICREIFSARFWAE